MTLTLDTHYKYDTFGRYYYLTPVGAELITGLDQLDGVWDNVERRLKSQGNILKQMMSLSVNDDTRDQYSKRDFIEYNQYKYTAQRNSVLYMLGEMAEWAYDTDGDRMVYEERNPMDAYNMLPITIRIEGNRSMMLTLAKVDFYVPDDEYQVGY